MADQDRPQPALHWPDAIEAQLKRGRDIKKAVDDNGGGIPTVDLTTANADAQLAEDEMATKAPGTKETRDGAFKEMKLQCELIMDLVYEATLTMTHEAAAAFILACGFFLKGGRGVINKRLFEARNGEVSGVIELVAKSLSDREAHEWWISLDKGLNWTVLTPTLQAKTKVEGYPRGTLLTFRHRVILKDGPGNWNLDDVVVL